MPTVPYSYRAFRCRVSRAPSADARPVVPAGGAARPADALARAVQRRSRAGSGQSGASLEGVSAVVSAGSGSPCGEQGGRSVLWDRVVPGTEGVLWIGLRQCSPVQGTGELLRGAQTVFGRQPPAAGRPGWASPCAAAWDSGWTGGPCCESWQGAGHTNHFSPCRGVRPWAGADGLRPI